MGYDPERALVTQLIETGDVFTVLKNRVTTSMFVNVDTRDAFDWALDQFNKHGAIPSIELLQDQFPDFEPEPTRDTLSTIADALKERRLYADMQKAMSRIATEARTTTAFEALNTFKSEVSTLAAKYVQGGSVDLTKAADAIRVEYKLRKRRKGVLGIPWPWLYLTRKTRGICPGAFYAFYGPPGSLKTWLLLYVADYAHRNHDARPIFFTQEMPVEDIQFRWAAMRAGVPYDAYQNGILSTEEERRFDQAMGELDDDQPPFIVEELEGAGQAAITEIHAKTKENNCNIVLVDGLGFTSDDLEWKSWGLATRGLKKFARTTKIPVIGTHHANRDRRASINSQDIDAKDVALGDTLFRDVDGLFRIEHTMMQREQNEIVIQAKKIREGALPCMFTIHAKPAYDFSQKIVPKEVADSSKNDDGDGDVL